ncbi:hypothetical protein SLEP1_g59577 [Rubroshorea leprosula]|uniref:RNA-dependent RNA polymerase n=1 Tax=Rubroshorea leprosula TaxID=152421 RepID=A0AAV5MUA2_9ROSI|nr:hypothetical protein SLEP1_g59577 [Rubroshorea leprosula]
MVELFDRSTSCPVSVSLTRCGYPRIIPSYARKIIYSGGERADRQVQLLLTFFSLFTIVEKAKRINKETFKSIRDPVENIDQVIDFMSRLKPSIRPLLLRYVPEIRSYPLEQGFRWIPSWKALPTYRAIDRLVQIFPELAKYRRIRSPFLMQTLELAAFRFLIEFVNSRGEQFCQGVLFPTRVRFAFDRNNKIFSGTDLDEFEMKVGPYLPPWHPAMGPVWTGRLANVVEGGGKRRVFAIGNWCNQRLLQPVHVWLSKILKSLETDGTFNQTAPLYRLKGSTNTYCYDLSAATDRWPLLVMFETMEVLLDRSFASAAVNSCLATNLFYIGIVPDASPNEERSWISFVAGQPLGYYSSWPLFALTHHLVVWWCAEQVYPGQRFTSYALLGDDIVIANEDVARKYAEVLSDQQVKISKHKSLISKSGAVEFAKRIMVRNVSVDISPATTKSVLGAHVILGRFSLIHRWPKIRFSTFRRLGGAGYKTCSRLPPNLHSEREKYEWLLWDRLRQPSFEFSLGGGAPLSPSQFWFSARFIVDSLKPKGLRGPPSDLFVSEEQCTFQEYTSLRGFVREWLAYQQWWFWYYRLVNNHLDYRNPEVKCKINRLSLQDILAAPICQFSWKVKRLDNQVLLSRFNLLHKLKQILDTLPVVRELPVGRVPPPPFVVVEGISYLTGPLCDNMFLVTCEGLINPHRGYSNWV